MGELPERAVVRECKEEMGCEVAVKRFLPRVQMNTWTHKEGAIKYLRHVFVLVFECHVKKGKPKVNNKEVSDIGWFTKKETKKLAKLPGMDAFIELV
ncbi:MAG: NUDIX domain-containing protein [Candidatus Sungbacteria bacterium]|nr:NUDIX domain-containing protein [Candidatus Sungbacteria bacterium]